ncbi:helix-turn-helix domain-containing protein, partial [Streptomyces hainanensis]
MHDVPELALSDAEREALRAWSAGRPDREVRARIVLDAAAGASVSDTARALGLSRPTVSSWRRRYAEHGLGGLEHRPRSGRPPQVDEADVVAATVAGPPAPRRAWSARALADHLGIAHSTLGAVWRRWGVDGAGDPPVTPPTAPPLTLRRPRLLGLWQDGDDVALVLADGPGEDRAPHLPAPAEERVARGAELTEALAGLRRAAREPGPGP